MKKIEKIILKILKNTEIRVYKDEGISDTIYHISFTINEEAKKESREVEKNLKKYIINNQSND